MIDFLKKLSPLIISAIIIFLLYLTFKPLVIYLVLGILMTLLLYPVKKRLDKIRIKNLKMGSGLTSFISIIILFSLVVIILNTIAPSIINQAESLSLIDEDLILVNLESQILIAENYIKQFSFIPNDFDLQVLLSKHLSSIINFSDLSTIVGTLTGITGDIILTTFCVFFIGFFLLKDGEMIQKKIFNNLSQKNLSILKTVLNQASPILKKYFKGVLLEVLIVISLVTIGLSIFGISNAILIGILAGILNVIPYLGPIISALIGLTFVIVTNIGLDFNNELLPMIYTCLGVFAVVQAIDNFLLQPLIHSNSVNAHPLEVFMIILMGGQVWGIKGMILAIPIYIIGKIFILEFLRTQETQE